MECNQMHDLICAYADGELDAGQRKEAERHLSACPACAQALEGITALKTAMRDQTLLYNVPGALRNRIDAMVEKAIDPPTHAKPDSKPTRTIQPIRYVAIAAAAVIVVAGGITAYVKLFPNALRKTEIAAVQNQQNSVSSNHLVDFASSDTVSVVRWLSNQLNFSPMAPIRLPAGFNLLGGRIDTLYGHRAAVLVYRNGSQTNSVFQYPTQPGAIPVSSLDGIDGLGVEAWQGSGMNFLVVSAGGTDQANQMASAFISQGCGQR